MVIRRSDALRTTRRAIRDTAFAMLVAAQSVMVAAAAEAPAKASTAQLLGRFETEPVFWRQFDVAKEIVSRADSTVLPQLEPWLSREDRHQRGNAAFIFAGLGDPRGLDVVEAILTDFSDRPEGQGIAATVGGDGRYRVSEQINTDRYYAVHLLGELQNPQSLAVLVPLLSDARLSYKVAWALGEIGGREAVEALISALENESPEVRYIAIESLQKLGARQALPRLRELVGDDERIHFDGLGTVGEAARTAIAALATSARQSDPEKDR